MRAGEIRRDYLLRVYFARMLRIMSTRALADGTEVRPSPATARPLLFRALAALSTGAAAIHFAVMFEHFSEYTLYGCSSWRGRQGRTRGDQARAAGAVIATVASPDER